MSDTAGSPGLRAVSTPIEVWSTWVQGRSCWARISQYLIRSTGYSTVSTSVRLTGATTLILTLHVNVRKLRLYDFNADYRNIAYFNYLPSYADPLLSRGIVLNNALTTHITGSAAFNSIFFRAEPSFPISPTTGVPASAPASPRL